MSPRKLTETDKEELLVAYRETAETTSTLAERYGVSSSTISRFLKSRLSVEEYEDLIQKKRLGRSNSVKKAEKKTTKTKKTISRKSKTPKPKLVKDSESSEPKSIEMEEESIQDAPVVIETESVKESSSETASSSRRRTRTRQARPAKEDKPVPVIIKADKNRKKPELSSDLDDEDNAVVDAPEVDEQDVNPDLLALAQEISLGDRRQALKELLGDDISDDDEDDDDDYNDDDEEQEEEQSANDQSDQLEEVQILPLAAARFPRTCYVVTDKMSELIARPMREFRDLGHIPEEESTKKTLPIFDNHRVAKRFTHGRSQKVIKVPDSNLFSKASHCLTSKGITHVLINGKIYNLS